MFMLVCFVYDIVPYQESTTLQLYPTAAAVGTTTYARSQMTDSRQHAESTTLQPCGTAAAVGDTIYVRLACLRYAAASYLCWSLPQFVTPPYHTFLLCCRSGCTCPSMRKHRDLRNSNNIDANPSLYIYVHRGSSLTSIFSVFFAKIADGKQQTTCGEQNATGRTMCVRVLYPLLTAASCFSCHSICHVLLSSCSLVLNTCRIPCHTCPFSLPGGP